MRHKYFLLPAAFALMFAIGGTCAWAKVLETRETSTTVAPTPQAESSPIPLHQPTRAARNIEGQAAAAGQVRQKPQTKIQAGSEQISGTAPVRSVAAAIAPEPVPVAAPRVAAPAATQLAELDPAAVTIVPNPANLMPQVSIPRTAVPHAQTGTTFLGLCYHDVEDADPDQTYVGVTTAKLVEQFAWFRDNGFIPVSVDDILMARAGGKPLPEKAILLTFDDGYVSFYTRVYPLLKSYNYPAVLAVVDSWIDGGGSAGDGMVDYAGVKMPASAFLKWDQIREMVKSGLVEVASHTHASHKGIVANPQGNLEPAIVSRIYNKNTKAYETDEEYSRRLRHDFTAAARKITHETGRAPRVMVWPYGQYNQFAIDAARAVGMPITMTLDDGFGTVGDLTAIPRYLINADPDLQGFVIEMRDLRRIPPMRAAMVDIDLVYSPDHEQLLKNLDALIARVYAMKVGTVFVKGYASDDNTGVTREVYFPNRHLPMRADLMNRVAWQLATRTGVKAYGVMPVLAFDLGAKGAPVLAWNDAQKRAELAAPRRISPFDPEGRRIIREIYEDMGRAVPLDGVVFAPDAALSEFEDASAPARAAYAAAGLPPSVADIRANSDLRQQWTRLKTETVISFTRDLVNATRTFRAPLMTVRHMSSAPIFDPSKEEKFAQEFELFQKNYDYTAVLAMPSMENVARDDAVRWLGNLVDEIKEYPNAVPRSIFMLETVDLRQPKNSPERFIPDAAISAQMRQLARKGAMNFSFTPDDFVRDQPRESALHGDFSLQTYPYRP
ncbi:MAG: poly-beta-1,6-N-acetyl-D-glucosamine N-deacetylase PgaB [Alphaproteobacteria bacterium]